MTESVQYITGHEDYKRDCPEGTWAGRLGQKAGVNQLRAYGSHRRSIDGTLKKGDEGRLENRSYQKDGVTHYVTEIAVRDIQLTVKAD
jgi:single-stranded DNA-binding protein